MATADTIIFDLGGVLIDWNPEYLYRKIFSNENDLRYFLEKYVPVLGTKNRMPDIL